MVFISAHRFRIQDVTLIVPTWNCQKKCTRFGGKPEHPQSGQLIDLGSGSVQSGSSSYLQRRLYPSYTWPNPVFLTQIFCVRICAHVSLFRYL